MFNFKIVEENGNKFLVKKNGEQVQTLAILHNGRFKSSISLPEFNVRDIETSSKEISKKEVEQSGFISSQNSSLQVINSNIRLDTSFLYEHPSYVENIDLVKNIIEAASDKSKGMIVFDNNGEIQKHLKSKHIEFDLYNKANLKIKYSDLNEKILLDVLSLSNREQSVIASFINFKQQNKGNEEIGIPVLDGSNWLYDLFIVEPSTLAQQFKVNEYSVKMLKTSMLQLNMNGMMSQEFSTIKAITQSFENGKIVVLDVKDNEKKLIKATLANNYKHNLIVVDNTYHKYDNIQYLLYDCILFSGTTKDFSGYILNRNSFYLKDELMPMQYYSEEFKFLDFEYLAIKKDAFPLIVTNEEHIKNNAMKKIGVTSTATANFF